VITEKLRIIHVLRAPLGGLFRHVIDLASGQAALGHEIGVFFDGAARSQRVDEALSRIPGGWTLGVGEAGIARNPGPTDLFALAKFRAFVARARPDVIHGHGAKGGLMARLTRLSQPPGAPIAAYTPHGGSFNYKAGSLVHHLYMAVERGLAPLTDLFLFESAYIASRYDRFVGVEAGLRRIVFNGLKPSEFEPIAPDADALDLVFIGELREAKGIDTLIAALPLLKPRRPAPRLALIGAGPDLEQFRRQAERLGVADRIDILGPLPARQGFRRGRVLVVPSRQESLPYVVLEAAAARVPVLASDVGGIPEIFGPYRGRLGRPGDPVDLALRIDRALDAEGQREREAAELSQYVAAHFSVNAMTDAVLTGYRDALLRRRSPELEPRAHLEPHG
jgi:glycosyltransferase involved in cell wall biosynthesis